MISENWGYLLRYPFSRSVFMNRFAQAITRWFGSSVLAIALLSLTDGNSQAQLLPPGQAVPQSSAASICQPPQSNEFLLLIVTRTPDTQTQVQQLLPPNTSITTCGYLSEVVTRVGGFRTVERANAWARYINESTGLGAYVVRPAETPSATTLPPTTAAASPSQLSNQPGNPTVTASTGYRPKPLGPGYAVLVDYFNQPETATKVQEILQNEVGLVSYRQSPFLLALYTNDASAAYGALQTLSDRGLWATIVDSRRVILLRQVVTLPQAAAR